jgi:voltage-gated sodium channel
MTDTPGTPVAPAPGRLRALIEHPRFERFIIALILINAVTLGLEAIPAIESTWGDWIDWVDRTIVAIFVLEIGLRFALHRGRFFRDPWNVFDFSVVAVALIPQTAAFSVLRTLRVLRALRLVSRVPSMRRVVSALLAALPGMGSIVALLGLLVYVASVMATGLFGAAAPEYFGSLGASLFTLFHVMTLEGWPDVARAVMDELPWAWAFFLVYILVSTFAVLNLFIAVIVNAMQAQVEHDLEESQADQTREMRRSFERLSAELGELRSELAGIRAAIGGARDGDKA